MNALVPESHVPMLRSKTIYFLAENNTSNWCVTNGSLVTRQMDDWFFPFSEPQSLRPSPSFWWTDSCLRRDAEMVHWPLFYMYETPMIPVVQSWKIVPLNKVDFPRVDSLKFKINSLIEKPLWLTPFWICTSFKVLYMRTQPTVHCTPRVGISCHDFL